MIAGPGAPIGSSVAEQLLLGRLRAANERLLLTSLRSQEEAEAGERLLTALAQFADLDELTQLPTRSVLFDRFTRATAGAPRPGGQVAILSVDIDRFKHVNETLGRMIGNAALKSIANAITACIGARGIAYRPGGNRYVILVTDLQTAESVAPIAAEILAAVAAPMTIRGHTIAVSASIGVSGYPGDSRDLLVLINQADAALYRGRLRGAGAVCYHERTTNSSRNARAEDATSEFEAGHAIADGVHDADSVNVALRNVNEQLVIATLSAHVKIEDAEIIQRRQTHFLALLAHELRNPLAPMRNVAAVLPLVLPGNAALVRMQSVLDRQVRQLSRLIDDLLDMSRHTTGKLRLTLSDVDMADIVADAQSVCGAALSARRQSFAVDILDGRLIVSGDAGRLTQIVTNLIDNASKYTSDNGNIQLTVGVGAGSLTLTVSDDGIGISAAALPHIFDLFVQDPAAVEVDRSGLGIGLALVRDLVAAHGGSVVATSRGVGHGSQFTVTLPLAAQH